MELRKYLPSTQFSLVVGAIILSAGLIGLATYARTPAAGSGTVTVAADVTNTEGFKDSDGDGLRDWEEVLYGSDPYNPDSNGNGVGDKQEAETTLAEADKSRTEKFPIPVEDSKNLTQTIGQSLFATYAEKQKQGGADTAVAQNAVIAEALSRAQALQEQPRVYTAADLKTVSDNAVSYREYGNAFVQTSKAYPRAGYDQALVAFTLYTESGSSKDALELSAIERDFSGLIAKLSSIPVPNHFAYVHAQTLTSLEKIRMGIHNMQAFKDDPVRGLLGAEQLRSDGGDSIKYLITIAKEFRGQGITFKTGEAGADWTRLQDLAFSDVLAPSSGAQTPQ